MMLLIGCSTFLVGVTAFYFNAEAAAFLFKPKQSTPEKTQSLKPVAATPPVFEFAPPTASSTAQYQAPNNSKPVCAGCVQDDECGLCETVVGEYTNYDYAYMFTVPDELRALKAPAPASDYGFVARLQTDPQAIIEVEGTYNEDSWKSLNEAVNAHIEYLKTSATDVVVLKRASARLGKRSAIRYIVQYTSIATGSAMIEDKTIAIRKDYADMKEGWTIYAVRLQTPASSYDASRGALEKILKRWREIPSGGC